MTIRAPQTKLTDGELTRRQARRLARPHVQRCTVVLLFAEEKLNKDPSIDAGILRETGVTAREVIAEAWALMAGWS